MGLIALVALISHFNILTNRFIWDDTLVVLDNERMADSSPPWDVFSRDYGLEIDDQTPRGFYRPLFVMFVWAQRQVFGETPFGYRIIGFLTLILAAWTLAGMTASLSGRPGAGVFAGILFAAHPAKTESVGLVTTWPDLAIVGLLAGAFWAGSRAIRREEARRFPPLAILSILLVFCAGLIKETAILIAPGLMLGLAAFGIAGHRKRSLGLIAGWVGAVAAIAAMRGLADIGGAGVVQSLSGPFTKEGAPAVVWMLGMGFRFALIPQPSWFWAPNPFDSANPESPLAWAGAAQAGLILAALAFIALLLWLAWRRLPVMTGLLGWLGGGLLSAAVAAAMGIDFSERYIPLAPMAGLIAIGLARVSLTRRSPGLWIAVGALAACSILSGGRLANSTVFWQYSVDRFPNHPYPRAGTSNAAMERGMLDEAKESAELAIRLAPDSPRAQRLGTNLGLIELVEERPEKALQWYEWTLERLPDNYEASKGRIVALAQLGRANESMDALRQALERWPNNPELAKIEKRIAERARASTNTLSLSKETK